MSLLKTQKNELDFSEYHHGGEMLSKSGGAEKLLDMSVNTNPLGLPKSVKTAIQNALAVLDRYPDPNCTNLREKIAEVYNHRYEIALKSQHILCGNGASELISLVTAAISPKNALILSPSFFGYEKALRNCDCRIHRHFSKKEANFVLDETIFDSIERASPDLIFLCSPNNPTGTMIEISLLEKIIAVCEGKGIFLLVDECFIDFTEKSANSAVRFVEQNPHLVVLNAFTKIYALAGLRLGFAVSSHAVLLQKAKMLAPEWNVSTVAQIAGRAALDEEYYIEETRKIIKTERAYLSEKLKALGFKVYPSEANFILFESEEISFSLGDVLARKGIFIRSCENFCGLTNHFYRIAVKTREENQIFLKMLKSVLCAENGAKSAGEAT